MDLSADDRIALHELAARYGNAIDERDWDRFDTVFTEDCRYELANFGRLDKVVHGRAAVRQMMEESQDHPIAHHVTSIEVLVDGDQVRLRSKILGPAANGFIGSGDYVDVVVRTEHGWRIADRLVTLRKPPRAQ